jgi:hypothetical protein
MATDSTLLKSIAKAWWCTQDWTENRRTAPETRLSQRRGSESCRIFSGRKFNINASGIGHWKLRSFQTMRGMMTSVYVI